MYNSQFQHGLIATYTLADGTPLAEALAEALAAALLLLDCAFAAATRADTTKCLSCIFNLKPVNDCMMSPMYNAPKRRTYAKATVPFSTRASCMNQGGGEVLLKVEPAILECTRLWSYAFRSEAWA